MYMPWCTLSPNAHTKPKPEHNWTHTTTGTAGGINFCENTGWGHQYLRKYRPVASIFEKKLAGGINI